MTGLTIPFLGLSKQYGNLRQEILDTTDQVLRSGNVIGGNYTAEFENWLAKKNNVKYAITVGSGTEALECIAEYNNRSYLKQNIAFVPSLTYIATANAFARAGYYVKFIDVDKNGCSQVEDIPELLEFNLVVGIGLFGAALRPRWKELSLNLVEDAAQHWLSNNCQRIGFASAISFDPTKNLGNYGSGGAVLTNSYDLSFYAQNWRCNDRGNSGIVATNSQMSEIDCAQLLVKTKYLNEWQQRRRNIASYWIERFANSPIRPLIDKSNFSTHSFHKFVIEVDNRDELKKQLAIRKIETKIHYSEPLWNQKPYLTTGSELFMSNSAVLSRRCLSLPIYPELTDLEVEYIIDQVLVLVE